MMIKFYNNPGPRLTYIQQIPFAIRISYFVFCWSNGGIKQPVCQNRKQIWRKNFCINVQLFEFVQRKLCSLDKIQIFHFSNFDWLLAQSFFFTRKMDFLLFFFSSNSVDRWIEFHIKKFGNRSIEFYLRKMFERRFYLPMGGKFY